MVVLKNQNRRSGIFYLRPLCGFGFFSKSDFSAIFFELTNTGIRFQYDYQEGTYSMEAHLEVVLKNGATIGYSGGSGTPLGDGTTLNCSYQWMIPVNIDEVQAIRIGSVEIPVG